jgi:glycosyltransferase involved in cell wall biosynthesis
LRLVFVTQTVDSQDPMLGATVAKIKALAARCDELVVISDRVGLDELPDNCVVLTFGARTRIGRGIRYLRALTPLLASRRPPDALIAHMCPIYLVLAAPLAKLRRMPLILWYTHWAVHRTLRLAMALCDAALSVDLRSLTIASPKVKGIGHGIDVTQFAARASAPDSGGPLRLLSLGRTSPTKGFATLVRACGRLRRDGIEITCDMYGPSTTDEERRHRVELQKLIADDELGEAVTLHEPVPRGAVSDLVRSADVVVNTHGGGLDKVVYESAACAVPVMACHPGFDEFLGGLPVELRFEAGNADDLARVIRAFADADAPRREQAGLELRRRVTEGHSVDTWADGVIATARRLRS